jgi:hypothetical protein
MFTNGNPVAKMVQTFQQPQESNHPARIYPAQPQEANPLG